MSCGKFKFIVPTRKSQLFFGYIMELSWFNISVFFASSITLATLLWLISRNFSFKIVKQLKTQHKEKLKKLHVDLSKKNEELQQLSTVYQKLQVNYARIDEALMHAQKQMQEYSSKEQGLKKDLLTSVAETKHEQIENKTMIVTVQSFKQQLEQQKVDYSNLKAELENTKYELIQEKIAVTQLQEKIKSLNFVEDSKEVLGNHFVDIANQLLEYKSKTLNTEHEDNLNRLLIPIKDKIDQFNDQIQKSQNTYSAERSILSNQLKTSIKLNTQMSQDAQQLIEALKGNRKLESTWGAMQIERLLEASGLIKGVEFNSEPELINDSGETIQPDFIVNLPDNKHLIIDSGVSLVNYARYIESIETTEAYAFKEKYYVDISNHIQSLAEKDYTKTTSLNSPNFVFLFIPVEQALSVALEYNPNLIYEAFEKHIIIVSPTSLLASLKTVANLWLVERQNKNARKLTDKATLVYEKLNGFVAKLEKLGAHIDKTANIYQDTMKSLKTGKGNLISVAQNFAKLGVRVKKNTQLTEENASH